MHDDIAKGAGAVAKFIGYYVIWCAVLLTLGRVTLLLVTLGRYPRGSAVERDANRISLVGVLVLLVAWSLIAIYNNTVKYHA